MRGANYNTLPYMNYPSRRISFSSEPQLGHSLTFALSSSFSPIHTSHLLPHFLHFKVIPQGKTFFVRNNKYFELAKVGFLFLEGYSRMLTGHQYTTNYSSCSKLCNICIAPSCPFSAAQCSHSIALSIFELTPSPRP